MQRTKVGHSLSSSAPVVSGVIQGSCLGPLLFVLYINVVVALFDQSCNCKLYADDLKLNLCMNSPNIVFVTSKNVSIDLLLGRISGNLTYRRKNAQYCKLAMILLIVLSTWVVKLSLKLVSLRILVFLLTTY